MTNVTNVSRRFRFGALAVPASAALLSLLCLSAAAPAHAQKMNPLQSKAKQKRNDDLEKAIGKADADLFNGVMNQFGDGKTMLRLITENTADIKQEGSTVNITSRSIMQGNYAGSFASSHEMTVHQGENSVTLKTQFVCDGKTLWTYKPDAKQYTEQAIGSMKASLVRQLMSSSLDIVALIGFSADDDGKSSTQNLDSAHVDMSLYKGFPCRVLTIVYSDKDKEKTEAPGTIKVYLGANKRLRGIQLKQLSDSPTTITETVKVMEPLPAPDKSLFTFTPPAGVVKVEKFSE